MSKRNVAKALRAADSGEAYHWPTIAAILATEVRRLQARVEQRDAQHIQTYTLLQRDVDDLMAQRDAALAPCDGDFTAQVPLEPDVREQAAAILVRRWGVEDDDQDAYDAACADWDALAPLVAAQVEQIRERQREIVAQASRDVDEWRAQAAEKDAEIQRLRAESPACGKPGHPSWAHDCAVSDLTTRLYGESPDQPEGERP